MKLLGIYGSPRKGGNTDLLLDAALEAAREAGVEVKSVYCRKLKYQGCISCGGCDKTGQCVIKDDMQDIYPLWDEAEAIILSTPDFFLQHAGHRQGHGGPLPGLLVQAAFAQAQKPVEQL